MSESIKILHTSDWHIGRTLYGRKRYDEFEAFLNWLAETIQQNEIDALLVAGDVFDNTTPSNRAQKLYYRFLCRVAASSCRHVVVVAGNHDSPSFLNAPKELLKALDVHVLGNAAEDPEEEVLVLRNRKDGQGGQVRRDAQDGQEGHGGQDAPDAPELIVCAVPYLRDRDIRVAEAGESVDDKERKLVDGIRNHYAAVAAVAERKREELGADIPIVAMGHLFTAGGKTVDGDGVRELYVGSLAHVKTGIFPDCFDYLALGHLHVPQRVNDSETIRYSGSPLPMGFGEAKQQKSVCRVDFNGKAASVQLIDVPVFHGMERVRGDWGAISSRIIELSATDFQGMLEVIYEGEEVIGDLRERLETAVAETQMEILRVKNNRIIDRVLGQIHEEETLDDLDLNDVFKRCLAVNKIPQDQHEELLRAYQETVSSLNEEDSRAE